MRLIKFLWQIFHKGCLDIDSLQEKQYTADFISKFKSTQTSYKAMNEVSKNS